LEKIKKSLLITLASIMTVFSLTFTVNASYMERVVASFDETFIFNKGMHYYNNYSYKDLIIPVGYTYKKLPDTIKEKTNILEGLMQIAILHHTCNYQVYKVKR